MKNFHYALLLVISVALSCHSQQIEGTELNASVFDSKIKSANNAFLLDVRTPGEFAEGYIDNAINIDYRNENFKKNLNNLDKNKTYFVYCLSGGRSSSAADYMRGNGFKEVYELKGGILAWQKNKFPLTSSSTTPIPDKISISEFNNEVSSGVVLVDFYATWCVPCQQMEPMLEEIKKEYSGKITLVRINIEENKQLALQQNVTEIPVFKIFKDGKETWTHKGLIGKDELIKEF